MKKTILLFTLVACAFASAQGQTIQLKGQAISQDSIAKLIVDNAKYRVYYSMSYSNDPAFVEEKTECQTLLLIGSEHSAFLDYNELRADSILNMSAKTDQNAEEAINKAMSVIKFAKFKTVTLKNYPQKKDYTFQIHVTPREKHRYTDPVQISWTLDDGTKEIAGYSCKRASCSFRGREYAAWYTTEIPLSEGPYVFDGLPGLILEISDTQGHYLFTINGMTQVKGYDPIYLKTKNVVNTTREQTRKTIRNLMENPATITQSMNGRIEISAENLVKVKAKPYNPIELE